MEQPIHDNPTNWRLTSTRHINQLLNGRILQVPVSIRDGRNKRCRAHKWLLILKILYKQF